MLKRRYSSCSFHRTRLLCAGLVSWLGVSCGAFAFLETFEGYAEGESIVGPHWEIGGTSVLPAPNTAIVQAGDYVTVSSQGNGQTINGRVSSRQFSAAVPRFVTDTDFSRIEVDIRRVSPGSRDESLTLVYLSLSGTHTLNIGFAPASGEDHFFFDFGSSSNRATSPWWAEIDKEKWYRFIVDLEPSTGDFSFDVIDLSDGASVWSGTRDSEGLSPFSPEEWRALALNVARPGSSPAFVQKADFDNISVPGPDLQVESPVGARLAEAVRVGFETEAGKHYRIESSADGVTWSPEGNTMIGLGGPAEHYFTPAEAENRIFRVISN